MINIVRGLMIVTLLTVAGCRVGTLESVNNAPFGTAPVSLTLADYRSAIIRAGATRGWVFEDVAPGHMVGNLDVRSKHFISVDLTFDTQSFSINYKSSRNMNYNAERKEIHPKYNGWVRFLRIDIQREIAKIQSS